MPSEKLLFAINKKVTTFERDYVTNDVEIGDPLWCDL